LKDQLATTQARPPHVTPRSSHRSFLITTNFFTAFELRLFLNLALGLIGAQLFRRRHGPLRGAEYVAERKWFILNLQVWQTDLVFANYFT
jgi:hypothetical protein